MTIRSVLKFAIADRDAWSDLEATPPSLAHLLLYVVAPVSLLPPIMLYYAGTFHGDQFVPGFGGKSWLAVASAFFIAEWATIAIMRKVIPAIADVNGAGCSPRSASVLAMLSPIPLWISSLVLCVPSLSTDAVVAILGLALSTIVTFHGVRWLCRPRDDVVAAAITQGIIGVELIGWSLMLVLVIPV